MVRLEEYIMEFSMKLEGWRKAADIAEKAGRGLRQVEGGGGGIRTEMAFDAESCRAAERHAKAVATPPNR